MDPPPLPPLPTTITTAPATNTTSNANANANANATAIQLNYPDSVDSSPRSRGNAETWVDEHLPPLPNAKLRFMCSYGGHIIPRPHDKSLCYIGGETRIVVVDRHSSLSDLCSRLSRTLLDGRPFTLKYQLPNEELDSLISVTTDEDLDNMIEEYDRTTSVSPLKPSRLRLFLFFSKPEAVASMGSLLNDAKSETWFVDALNNAGILPRGMSDSATMDCVLHLDGVRGSDSCNDVEAEAEAEAEIYTNTNNNKQVKSNVHDLHSMPDSSMVENTSSYGSTSSSPSMSNLPPIRVRVEDQKVGMEEQFAQVTFAPSGLKQDDGFGLLNAPVPPLPTAVAAASTTVAQTAAIHPMVVRNETVNRAFSDDEKSDHGVPVGFRKPPLPLQTAHLKAGFGGYSLPSPDSVASDGSIASASSVSIPVYYQDQVHVVPRDNRGPNSPDTKSDIPDSSSQTQLQHIQDPSYISQLDQQQQQQQFVHASSTHYMPHPATSPVPMSSYYPVYASPSQQQLHHPIDQQYQMYVMSVSQAQPYNMSMQSNMADTSRPLTPPNPAAYKDAIPPIYPTKTTTTAKPEMAASGYRTLVTPTQQLVQVPCNQFQQQYVGYPQMHHPSQSIAVASSANPNYGFEYTNPPNDQMYYTHQAAPLPPQYKTMTAAAAAIALSDASKQLPTDSQQQNRTSQPL